MNKIISLILSVITFIVSLLGFNRTYNKKDLFDDINFQNGFSVVSMEAVDNQQVKLGDFVYSINQTKQPSWTIAQWNSKYCLWENKIESDPYTITDGKTKTIKYNPEDKSLSMRLNACNVYNGLPADENNWPHLLIEQSPIPSYFELSENDKLFYRCDSDKMILSMDIRLKDFKDTTNKDGINACQFLAYLYLRGVNSDDFVWFGMNLFDSRGLQDTYWSLDTAGSNNMIYSLSTADTYGTARKSLYRKSKPYVSDEWTHIELDLTNHIKKFIRKANQSGLYEKQFTREDFYISGANIGFEIHGNFDCTVDIKNFQLSSYREIK